jgi:hypothetical protein
MRIPKLGLSDVVKQAVLRNRAERIADIRARLADVWKHMQWEEKLMDAEMELRRQRAELELRNMAATCRGRKT